MDKLLATICQYKRDLIDTYKPHLCSRSFCNPQTLYDLVGQGDQDVYLCKYRFFHICNQEHCHCSLCPISGRSYNYAVYNAYDSDVQSTWNAVAEEDNDPTTAPMPNFTFFEEPKNKLIQKKPEFRSKINRSDASTKIELLIDKLLFSSKRDKMNEEFIESREKVGLREREAYIVQCQKQGVPVNMIRLQQMLEYNQTVTVPLEILQRDDEFVQQLVSIILQVCEIVERQVQSKICIISVALGVLYLMQRGHVLESVTLIPQCPFLLHHLPNMNTLSRFGVEKSKFTRGQQVIMFAYDAALRKGINVTDLCVKFT